MEKFYLTTAITYTSGIPHIGNVYEAILADAMCRYKRFTGYDVYFQTGTDEHGIKIEDKAKAAGKAPQEFVDEIAREIRRIYDSLGISYDYFMRTTNKTHEDKVGRIFKRFFDQGDIYKGFYEGHYCKACESFFTKTQLVDGCCPDCGGKVSLEKEEAYFFRMSKYQQRLIDHINANPDFIYPESRKNEMINNFLKDELPDLCVSRTTFDWGVKVPFDPKHVVYVWIDALSNYITDLGYDPDGNHSELFNKYWPADVHLIGKDILRFHTIYWPIMLMALGLELPKQVFAHPWILFNKDKMSKSKGNTVYTDELIKYYGVDATRYFVLRYIPYAQDGNLTHELMIEAINNDLANTLGNLVNRTITMQRKYFPDGVTFAGVETEVDRELVDKCYQTRISVEKCMNDFRVGDALEEIMSLLRRANKYIDENEPWKLAKDEASLPRLENVLYTLLETIRHAAILLQSFIPDTAKSIINQLNVDTVLVDTIRSFGLVKKYSCNEPKILFARIDGEKLLAQIEADKPKVEVKQEPKDEITFEDFSKVKFVVGKVVEAKKHPDAEKLLVLQVNIGSETRQVVAGIAAYYTPEEILNKKVVVCINVKEAELRGVKSQGVILCGQDKKHGKCEIVTVSDNIPEGAIVS